MLAENESHVKELVTLSILEQTGSLPRQHKGLHLVGLRHRDKARLNIQSSVLQENRPYLLYFLCNAKKKEGKGGTILPETTVT